MIQYCIDKWEKNKDALRDDIRENPEWKTCDYFYVVNRTVTFILNDGKEICADEDLILYDDRPEWNANRITEINDGWYQGTLLYLIPRNEYCPAEYDYLMGFIGYGSCFLCDTLERIHIEGYDFSQVSYEEYLRQKMSETQVNDYMALCKDFICGIIKPYNNGWREEPEFDTIESSGSTYSKD